ncbi:MAG: bifunctional oligoribonuclease/PAP phosphatase NrnA [Bdellovibrionales bacterium]|nr:bifunctional oligoribonuclease/PAP phosphatase NrnA [Oligoflexia bacterium]
MSQKKTKVVPLSKSPEFAEFKSLIGDAKRILISTHVQPDGDGLGTEVALYHYLKRARKSVRIYNPDTLPKRYRFLDPEGTILLGPGEVEIWDQCDLWIIVDTNDPRRLGKVWNEMPLRARKIVFLDHHPDLLSTTQDEIQYPQNSMIVSDHHSSSIGELLYQLFSELNLTKLNSDMALGLYVSIMTDTNSFRYSRTTPESHRIASEMIELGVNPEEVYQQIYSTKELCHIQLLGLLLQHTKVSKSGKLAWMELRLDLRKKFKASADDTMSFLNILLVLRDAEVVCIFREEDDGEMTRVSIKSKGKVIVNRVAMELGGGGHEYAAGLALRTPFEQVVETVTSRIESLITTPPHKPLMSKKP